MLSKSDMEKILMSWGFKLCYPLGCVDIIAASDSLTYRFARPALALPAFAQRKPQVSLRQDPRKATAFREQKTPVFSLRFLANPRRHALLR
jgi:hypothetical protein